MKRFLKRWFLLLGLSLLFMGISQPAHATAMTGACQCTDFVRLHRSDLPQTMGHAKDWLASARFHRFPYDQIPQVGDVAVFLRGEFGFSIEYGHVALVIQINEARDHFGIAGWDGLKADCQVETYFNLPVTANTIFIHHKEITDEPFLMSEWLLPLVGFIDGWQETPQESSEDGLNGFVEPLVGLDRNFRHFFPSPHADNSAR